jgi:hypothetical protein
MTGRKRDPALRSDALLIRELENAGFSVWFVARRGDRIVSGPDLDAVVRRALKRSVKPA